MTHGNAPENFFSVKEKDEIVQAIQSAERDTSGEIRVHLVRSFKSGADPLEAGKVIFEKLGMTKTKLRNGVLFLLELKNHRLVLLGDRGIHERVGDDFWRTLRDKMIVFFKQGEFAKGLMEGIEACGRQLKEFFPYQSGDVNELPDQISHSLDES